MHRGWVWNWNFILTIPYLDTFGDWLDDASPLICYSASSADLWKREEAGNCTRRDLSHSILFLVTALLRWLSYRGSLFDTTHGAMSGIVWKEQNLIICFETPFENCLACLRVYHRKASLDHPHTGMPARYISIAALNCRECVPIFCSSKRSWPLPTEAQAEQSAASTWCDAILSSLSCCQTMQTGVSGDVPGYFQILFILDAPIEEQGRVLRHLSSREWLCCASSHFSAFWTSLQCYCLVPNYPMVPKEESYPWRTYYFSSTTVLYASFPFKEP